MDPFLLVSGIVVVVLILIIIYVAAKGDFIRIYTGHVILKTFPRNVKQILQTDASCSTDNTLTMEADTITNTLDFSKHKATQTDDSDLFITCCNHIQAPQQENLIAADTLEHMVEHFNTALSGILEHSNWNFQVLVYQLYVEFHSYMQYALTQASASAIQVPELIDFQTLQTTPEGKQKELPNLHIKHYAHYEQFEIQEADEEIKKEEQGARPKDPTKPWSTCPFG